MTKPIIGPLGLLSAIAASMVLCGCTSMEERKHRTETIERIQAEARARLEQEDAKEHQEQLKAEAAALEKWKHDNAEYIRGLCTSAPGAEHQYAWDNYRVAVSTDAQHSSEAARHQRPIIKCEENKTSSAGYTWSNGALS